MLNFFRAKPAAAAPKQIPTPDPQAANPAIYAGHSDQAFGPTTYAQSGEDLIAVNIFCLMGNYSPTYLDIGANHPWHCNNTALLYKRGARGVAIDASPDIIALYKQERPGDTAINIGVGPKSGRMPFYRFDPLSGRSTFSPEMIDQLRELIPTACVADTIDVEVMTLNQVVDRFCGGTFPDFLSIDAEGLDAEIVAGADFSKSRPAMVCVEAKSGRGDDNPHDLSRTLKGHGFLPYSRTWSNAIFLSPSAHAKVAF